jgi:hypothetical protein
MRVPLRKRKSLVVKDFKAAAGIVVVISSHLARTKYLSMPTIKTQRALAATASD